MRPVSQSGVGMRTIQDVRFMVIGHHELATALGSVACRERIASNGRPSERHAAGALAASIAPAL